MAKKHKVGDLSANRIRMMRRLIFWIAQAQDCCPGCGDPLLVDGKERNIYDLTFEHSSGSYDHAKKCETGKPMGGYLMHKTCHKSKTMKELGIYKNRKNVKNKAKAFFSRLILGESIVVDSQTIDEEVDMVDMFEHMTDHDPTLMEKSNEES